MGGSIIQSGSLAGSVSSTGTLQADVVSQAELEATIASEGTLEATMTAAGTLEATIASQGTLEGSMSMPEKVVVGTGVKPKIREVTLLASAWEGSDNMYHQVVEIEGVTENSMVDVTPSGELIQIYYNKDLTIVAENEDGKVTVYCIGQKLMNDYTMQAVITEVDL